MNFFKFTDYKTTKITFIAFFIWSFLSCTNAQAVQTEVLELVESGNVEKAAQFTHADLKKIAKLQDGSLYYLAMHLKEKGNIEAAKKLLRYGFEHYDAPYRELCKQLFLRIATTDEQIRVYRENISQLEKTLKRLNKKSDTVSESAKNATRSELEVQRDSLNAAYLEAGLFDKLSEPLETYAAKTKMTKPIAASFERYFNENSAEIQRQFSDSFLRTMTARILCVNQYYRQSADIVLEILRQFLENNFSPKAEGQNRQTTFFTRPVISDFGKALLSGVSGKENITEAINLWESVYVFYSVFCGSPADAITIANLTDNQKNVLHTLAFYTARLYEKLDKSESVSTQVIAAYEAAQNFAPNDADFDNALWYELKFCSTDKKLYFQKLRDTAPLWKNDYWYEDIISDLSLKYTQEKNIPKLRELLTLIEPTALNEAKAKLRYTIGRLSGSMADITEAFKIKQDTFYYTLMAGYMIGKPARFAFQNQYARYPYKNFSYEQSKRIVDGLIRFSLYASVYPHIREYDQMISVSNAEAVSTALHNAGCIAESIQVMNYALRSRGAEMTPESVKLLYPRGFSESVTRYAAEYGIAEYFVYALIRAESFFRPNAVSHAGAIGLMQLMPTTANDIARMFKLQTYNSTDPDTNIRFGVYYLKQMIKNQGQIAKACQAYNAGGGNVRRWTRSYGTLPADIFTEVTPFPETRNYAKQILEAACMYAQLYYNTPPEKVIKEFYGF